MLLQLSAGLHANASLQQASGCSAPASQKGQQPPAHAAVMLTSVTDCPFVLRLTRSPNAVHNRLEMSCVPLCYTSQIRALVSGTVCSQRRRINLYYTACQPHLNYFSHLLLYMGPLGNDGNIFGGFVCLLLNSPSGFRKQNSWFSSLRRNSPF